ncbi:MAG: LysM peptidoglycan-binding domain-containing protein [Victivallales bacterium]|nr:LysM peptidoglycan-binding domain-containing protein [Victivallales bacterium]
MALFILLICLVGTFATAQDVLPQRLPFPIPPMPPIAVKLPVMDNIQPVQVTDVAIEANVDGVLTETKVTMTLHNPNGRVLEGELNFPLPTGATVAGYALDVNGKMVDGVIVEKEKSRAVFDEVVRQGVDPGLAEQVGGNLFRTKVYPINAGGDRRVSVRYVSTTLTVSEGGSRASYYVQPLNFQEKLRSFKLTLNVAAALQPPKVVAGSLSNLEFKKWKTVYTATTELQDIALTEDLYVAVMTRPEETFLHQKASDGNEYFTYHFTVDPASLKNNIPRAQEPVILWDASMSRDKSDHTPELAFLQAAFGKARKLTLITFRNVPEPPVVFASVAELVKALENVIYDGATNLAAAVDAIPEKSEAFLFSDGLDNFSAVAAASKAVRFCTFTSDKQLNASALQALVGNGLFLDLRGVSTEDAVKLLDSPRPFLASVICDGKPLPEVAWHFSGDRLTVAGALPVGAQKLVFELSIAGTTTRREVAVSVENGLEQGTLLRTNFGQLKIARLLASGAPSQEVTAAGKLYGLVTPGTSLLVLDNLSQYLRYNIRPPESLPEMRAQYDARHKEVKNSRWGESFQLQENSIDTVLSLWNNLKLWYDKDFPKVASVTSPQSKGETMGVRNGVQRRNADAEGVQAERMLFKAAPAAGAVRMEEAADMVVGAAAPAMAPLAKKAAPNGASGPKMVLQAWNPKTPYLTALKEAAKDAYQTYLAQRKDYASSAGFYMDCSDFFEKTGERKIALRVLSNLAEMDLENKQVLRILGYKLRFLGELEASAAVFRAVLKLAPEEPQSYRDLALVLDDLERFQEAADMMLQVVKYRFDGRFREIEVIALTELNRILLRAERKGVAIQNVDKRFLKPIQTDIRVVINWDTDMSDMDLWVTDTFGEKCFYSHRFTSTGGRNSCDFTQGYGPEEFMIRNAVKGTYRVQTDYYGTSTQKVLGAVTLYAEVYTNYARENENRQFLAYRLDSRKQVIDVATIDHDGVHAPKRYDKPFSYQIKKGDTLTSIAKQFYGDASYVDDIVAANPGMTKDAVLKIGAILTLPATRKQ